MDFLPEERPDGNPRGVKFLRVTDTVPAFAEVSVHAQDGSAGLGDIELVIPRAAGRCDPVERHRDPAHGAIWFEHGGEVFLPRSSLGRKRLQILPHRFLRLLQRGVGRDYGESVLAY